MCFGYLENREPPEKEHPDEFKGLSLKELNEVRKKHPKLPFNKIYEKALKKRCKRLIKKVNVLKEGVIKYLEKNGVRITKKKE